MIWLRSTLFNVLLLLWTIILGVICLPLLVLGQRGALWVADSWVHVALWLVRTICGIGYRIEGYEESTSGVIYACKHQSAWETIALWRILQRPVFILKKELLMIPIFGFYLQKIPHIAIDRKAGRHAMRKIIEQSRMHVLNGSNIIIFPEGTRTAPGHRRPYKQGVASLYEQLGAPIVPVALNSGYFWGRNAFHKHAGTITVKFLPAMPAGLEREAFLQQLQAVIETECEAMKS